MNILDQTFYHYNCNDITNIDQNLLSFEIIISMNSLISNNDIKKYNNQYSIESAKKELYKIDDENFNLIFKKTKLIEGKEYNKWEWNFIDEIIDISENRKDFIMELYKQKFFKRLLYFFMPSKNQFVKLAWNIDNLKYVEVGNKFFKLLSESKEGINILDQSPDDAFLFSNGITWYEDVQNYIENLIIITNNVSNNNNNIVNINSNNSTKSIKENYFTHDRMLMTMSFYIFTFLGIIGQTSFGDDYLYKKGYYKLIENIIESNCNNNHLDYIIKCIIDNFNFKSQNAINIIKNKLVKNCSIKIKRYLFEHIKCLLKFGKDILLDINFFIDNLINNNNENNNNNDSNKVIINILTNLALEDRYIEDFSKNQNLIKILETTTNKEILYIMMRNNKGFDNLKTFIDNEIKNINIEKIIKDYGNKMEDIMNNIFNNDDDDDFNVLNNNNNYYKIYLPKIDNLYKNTYEFYWLKQLPFNVNINIKNNNYLLNSYLEYIDDKNIILYSNFNNNNNVTIDINNNVEIRFNLLLGSFYVDKNFRENNNNNNTIIFTKNEFDNIVLVRKEIDYYKIEKEGVIIILKPLDNNNNKENKITNFSIYSVYFNIKIYPEKKLSLKTPINILTELPNNEKGFNILIENNFIEQLLLYFDNEKENNNIINENENNINLIINSSEKNNNISYKKNKKYNTKDIKSVLWILSKILIKEKYGDLIEEKYKIIEKIISYQKSCDDYAMKGTICYILCYISQNKNLKNIIENNNYIYYFNTEICYPKNINELYIDNTFIYENKKIKENYDKINKFINLNEKTNEIYNNITSLVNNITYKQSFDKLIEIKKKDKNLFNDSNLLIKIYSLLCRFKFRQQIRKTILDFMEVAINNQETIDNAIKIMDNIGKNLFEFNEEENEEEEEILI